MTEGDCSETGCTIFDCDRDWTYAFWAGYGPSASDVTWVAHDVRFPSSGELRACTHSVCEPLASPAEEWVAADDPRYAFEFEVPATEALYVMATGTEDDVWTDDDPFASPEVRVRAGRGLGCADGSVGGDAGGLGSVRRRHCDDCYEGIGGTVTWRITRVE